MQRAYAAMQHRWRDGHAERHDGNPEKNAVTLERRHMTDRDQDM